MLDLDAIRRRWAVTPWTNGRSPELAADIAALLSEVARLTAALAAAQTEVVEWRTVYLDGEKWYAAQPPEVCLLVGPNGWQMWKSVWAWVMKLNPMDSGPETGPAGKAACEAAYRRACGLPAIPACAG